MIWIPSTSDQEPVSRLLLVDDEPALIGVLAPAIEAAGFRVGVARNGAEALHATEHFEPHVVLLDLGLPDVDGKEIISLIRQRSEVPIIVVSARHQEGEKVAALDNGADDYVNKPFEIGELMARIRAALRRSKLGTSVPAEVVAGPLRIDLPGKRVFLEDELVKLSPKEWMLLQELALSGGQVVTHQRLLAAGWASPAGDQQYLRVYIGFLRQKLEAEPSRPELVLTEPGIGYRLAAPAGREVEIKFA